MTDGGCWCGEKKKEEGIEEIHKGSEMERGMMVHRKREMVFGSQWIRHERKWQKQAKEETHEDDERE